MLVGAEERVERAGKDVVARGRQETEGAGRVPWGEQGKAYAGDREVVPPREEPMTDGDGVFTLGNVALRRGGLGKGVVGDEQGTPCVGEGVVDLEARVGEANAGSCRGMIHPTVAVQPSADRRAAASTWFSRASSQVQVLREYRWRGGGWPPTIARHSRIRSPCSESSGSPHPSWAVMYPLQSAKCHELDRKTKVGSAEGPRAVWATHAVYSSAM